MSTFRYGIGIGRHRVSVATRRSGMPMWSGEAAVEESVQAALLSLLKSMPRPRFGRPAAYVVVGPSLSRVKPILNLPATRDATVVDGILRESPRVFFAYEDANLLAGGAWRSASGEWWGTAMDADMVAAVMETSRRAGVRIRGFVPAAMALPRCIAEVAFTWQDGDVSVEVESQNGLADSVRLRRGGTTENPTFTPPLSGHHNPASIADAWAATEIETGSMSILAPEAGRSTDAVRQTAPAITAIAGALTISAVLPVFSVGMPLRRAAAEAVELQPQAVHAEDLDRRVERITMLLQEAAEFDQSRLSAAALLNEIASALEADGIVENIVIDAPASTATLTLVSNRIPTVLRDLRSMTGITALSVSGPIERVDSGPFAQRVTVKLAIDIGARRARERR